MRHAHVVAALLLAAACRGEPAGGAPARVIVGRSDVVVVHGRRPARIPVRVLDRAGQALPDTGVRFAWAAGDSVAVSAHGDVTCVRRGDAVAQAMLGPLAARFLVRCRPVETLRFGGPIQLVLGDTARTIPVAAYGPDGEPTEVLDGTARVGDGGLVDLDGLRVRPRRWGASTLTVSVGDRRATTGLHVYEPATTLEGLDRHPRLVAVPVRLEPGEMRRWSLPWGVWMLTMWPEDDDASGLRLRIEGASCRPAAQISERRYLCSVTGAAAAIVYAPWRAGAGSALTGTLAVKPSGETRRAPPAPLTPAARPAAPRRSSGGGR